MRDLTAKLSNAELCRFGDWPNRDIPKIAPGVYTIYDRTERLLYVGMAGAGLTEAKIKSLAENPSRCSGLYDRLNSHASGYRSGDRFNIYIGDIFVLPTLSKEQIRQIAGAEISLDAIIKAFIRKNLSYRYLVTRNTETRTLEDHIQRQGIDGVLPSINGKG
jgi:hypothetical protein